MSRRRSGNTKPLSEEDLDRQETPAEEAQVEEAPEVETAPAEALQAELEQERVRANQYLEGWQRAQADFSNYKKRNEREQEELRARITGDIILPFLPILDDMQRALRERPDAGEMAAWAEGIDLIYRKFKALLESHGLETILAVGERFDPNLHEALTYEDSDDHQDGEIIDIIQQGYRIGERVLRPALVRVSK